MNLRFSIPDFWPFLIWDRSSHTSYIPIHNISYNLTNSSSTHLTSLHTKPAFNSIPTSLAPESHRDAR